MRGFLLTLGIAFVAAAQPSGPKSAAPNFDQYPVTTKFTGTPVEPVFASAEQHRYRSRIRAGVFADAEPNFAGHYFVIRWSCGSDCLMMAVADAETGKVYNSPLSGSGTGLYVSMDPMTGREIEFRPDSSLMILRNGCSGPRTGCGIYYFSFTDNRFRLIKRTLVDLTKASIP